MTDRIYRYQVEVHATRAVFDECDFSVADHIRRAHETTLRWWLTR